MRGTSGGAPPPRTAGRGVFRVWPMPAPLRAGLPAALGRPGAVWGAAGIFLHLPGGVQRLLHLCHLRHPGPDAGAPDGKGHVLCVHPVPVRPTPWASCCTASCSTPSPRPPGVCCCPQGWRYGPQACCPGGSSAGWNANGSGQALRKIPHPRAGDFKKACSPDEIGKLSGLSLRQAIDLLAQGNALYQKGHVPG